MIGLFDLDDEAFRRRFRHTPLWRAKRRGILRNAAIVLGNQRAVVAAQACAVDAPTPSRSCARRASGRWNGSPSRSSRGQTRRNKVPPGGRDLQAVRTYSSPRSSTRPLIRQNCATTAKTPMIASTALVWSKNVVPPKRPDGCQQLLGLGFAQVHAVGLARTCA